MGQERQMVRSENVKNALLITVDDFEQAGSKRNEALTSVVVHRKQ
jgi:hypothetical protein